MTISVKVNSIGDVGVSPRRVRIHTTDSVATVLTAGYLNKIQSQGVFRFNESDLCAVVTRESATAPENSGWYEISKTGSVFSLVPIASPGNAKLPTTTNALAYCINATGKISTDPANVSHNGDVFFTGSVNAGGEMVTDSNLSARKLLSYPPTPASGRFEIEAVNNSGGDFSTILRSASNYAQNQVIVIPDSGAASANVLLDTGAANILNFESFIGIGRAILADSNPSTIVRLAQGNWALRKTGGVSNDIISFDISEDIRLAANKGFRLQGFDLIYSISGENLSAHMANIDQVTYVQNTPVSVSSVSAPWALAVGILANPYVSSISVDTPAFNNTENSKYVLEIESTTGASTVYDFMGIVMKFSKTIG